jgi:hypothetical protein
MRVRRVTFDWLTNGPYVRGQLRDIRSAIRKGDFDGKANAKKRGALVKAIERVAKDPNLSGRARCALAQLVIEIANPFASRVKT